MMHEWRIQPAHRKNSDKERDVAKERENGLAKGRNRIEGDFQWSIYEISLACAHRKASGPEMADHWFI